MNSIYIILALTVFSQVTFADLICGKATYNCINPSNGTYLIENKKAERHCTINENLSNNEMEQKLNYYQYCNSIGGIVTISSMNK